MERKKVSTKDFQIQIGSFSIYKCPECKGNDLKPNYKHCPHCGVELDFSYILKKENEHKSVYI